jgi:hypothetical protein
MSPSAKIQGLYRLYCELRNRFSEDLQDEPDVIVSCAAVRMLIEAASRAEATGEG